MPTRFEQPGVVRHLAEDLSDELGGFTQRSCQRVELAQVILAEPGLDPECRSDLGGGLATTAEVVASQDVRDVLDLVTEERLAQC